MLKEFKEFVMKGNVVDLAVAVLIGGAFGKIVNSLVVDIMTPVIGMVGGQPDFSGIVLGGNRVMVDGKQVIQGGVMLGNFLNAVVSFLMIAVVVFLVFVKPMQRLRRPAAPEAPAEPPADVKLLAEIRDLLKDRQDRAV